MVELARDLVGLHATDPASVFLSARSRIPDLAVSDVEAALYRLGTLVKHLCMRRTLFVMPRDLVPVVQAACTDAIAASERRRLAAEIEKGGVARSGARWVARTEKATLAALASMGEATGSEISRQVPALRTKLTYAPGKPWGGEVAVTTRVLTIMAAEGTIVRGRPDAWTSSRHRWRVAGPTAPSIPELDARVDLVRRWLRTFGPAPVGDLVWWTGLGVGKIRAALAELDIVEVDLDGEPGVLLSDDLTPERPVEPWAAFLPSLDPTTMGWKRRDWYLGDHSPHLFDRNGNAGPTVWWDGRIVGGWAARPGGEVIYELLEDPGRDAATAIEAEAAQLQEWLGDASPMPRFPTPLDMRLRSESPFRK